MQTNMNLFLSSCLFLLCLSSLFSPLAARRTPSHPSRRHNISAVFAFGDSTLDPGNNNFLNTIVKANHTPYGQDFPGGVPTGRFSNGKLITDFIVSALRLKDNLQAYSDESLTTADLLTGVSFASAGSGLDNLTADMSSTISIGKQVQNFEEYLKTLRHAVGKHKAEKVIKDALIVISVGSNDIIFNYYSLNPTQRSTYTLEDYQAFLVSNMMNLVQRLYKLGGRKFMIAGLPPLGCLPFQITTSLILQGVPPPNWFFGRTCVDQQNQAAVGYNSELRPGIRRMQHQLPGTKFAYVDVYTPLMDMIQNPTKYGFTQTTLGCCGAGGLEIGPMCRFVAPVNVASRFLFWDSVHPTQAAYEFIAKQLMRTVLPQITG